MKILGIALILVAITFLSGAVGAEQTIQLSTINWQPYSGKNLPDDGFFSELVTEAFSRVGYQVEFKYSYWAEALGRAIKGEVHGVMDAYWKKDRTEFLEYPDVVWRVREEFIVLRDNPITYTGNLADLKEYTISVLRGSLQAHEIRAAGLKTILVDNQTQNVRLFLAGRFDVMLIPRSICYYNLEHLQPNFKRSMVKFLKPPYKVYDMYVAFSKQKPNYKQLTADFNRGLNRIKTDGTFGNILQKHNVMFEE